MAYTSDKKPGALNLASSLADANNIVVEQSGSVVRATISQLEAKIFDGKTVETTPAGTEVVVVRRTDDSLRQVALSNIVPAGNITNEKVSNSAAIVDTKLATIATAGKVANSATTATSANTQNAIVSRDGSGNFTAGTITAALSGNATTATTLASGRTVSLTGDVTGTTGSFNGSANVSAAVTISNNAVGNTKLRDSAACSVIGKSANASGDPEDIAASNNDQVLRRVGDVLEFGSIPTNCLADDAVTFSKIQNSAAAGLSVLGRSTNSAGDFAEINAGADGQVLRRSGTSLGFGQVVAAGLATDAVETAKIKDGNVTNVKLASDLDAGKLTAGTLPAARIAPGAINASKLGTDAVETAKINGSAVTLEKLAAAVRPIRANAAAFSANKAFSDHTIRRTERASVVLGTDGVLYVAGGASDSRLGRGVEAGITGVKPVMCETTHGYTPFFQKFWINRFNLYALDHLGWIWCEGNNPSGQLGNNTTIARGVMRRIDPSFFADSPITQFSVNPARTSDQVTCVALTAAGVTYGWGHNGNGQLGNGTTNNVLQPTVINQTSVAKVFVLGEGGNGSQVFLLKSDGTAVSAGYNSHGQLGHGTNFNTAVSAFGAVRQDASTSLANIVDIAGGDQGSWNSIFFRRSDNTLWSCGYNGYGQLGNGTTTNTNAATNKYPSQVLTDVAAVVAANETGSLGRVFAVKTDKSLWGTGHNGSGQLGLGDTSNRSSFTQSTTNVEKLAVGHYSTAVIKSDGYLYSVGANNSGQLGSGGTTNRTSFGLVPFNGTLEDVAFYGDGINTEHMMVVTPTGKVYATGPNGQGQIGDGTVQQQHMLTQYLIPQ